MPVTDTNITAHLAFPPRIGPDGTFATVDEGAVAELEQAVAVVLTVRQGSLIDDPTFGRPALTGQREGVAAQQAQAACAQWEPRASETIVDQGIVDHVETIDITAGPA